VSVLARSLHVIAAITWIGGMLFVALVLAPVAHRLVHDFVLGPRPARPAGTGASACRRRGSPA
jgi:hypothetical protein